jgi:hypothetical protein
MGARGVGVLEPRRDSVRLRGFLGSPLTAFREWASCAFAVKYSNPPRAASASVFARPSSGLVVALRTGKRLAATKGVSREPRERRGRVPAVRHGPLCDRIDPSRPPRPPPPPVECPVPTQGAVRIGDQGEGARVSRITRTPLLYSCNHSNPFSTILHRPSAGGSGISGEPLK